RDAIQFVGELPATRDQLRHLVTRARHLKRLRLSIGAVHRNEDGARRTLGDHAASRSFRGYLHEFPTAIELVELQMARFAPLFLVRESPTAKVTPLAARSGMAASSRNTRAVSPSRNRSPAPDRCWARTSVDCDR